MQQPTSNNINSSQLLLLGLCALAICVELAAGVITVQIGGATRLNSLSRQRDRYNCYWDCDLVGCQIARDDDECAYDCEKICRVRYDYSTAARSGAADSLAKATGTSAAGLDNDELLLKPKSGAIGGEQQPLAVVGSNGDKFDQLVGTGTSVRLHLPRNASARNFAIWERCADSDAADKLAEKPFSL